MKLPLAADLNCSWFCISFTTDTHRFSEEKGNKQVWLISIGYKHFTTTVKLLLISKRVEQFILDFDCVHDASSMPSAELEAVYANQLWVPSSDESSNVMPEHSPLHKQISTF